MKIATSHAITQTISPPFHKHALAGLLILCAMALPSHAHEIVERDSDPCAAAASEASNSAASAASSSGPNATAEARSDKRRRSATSTTSSCSGANCNPSSNVTSGPAGLAGSTTLPDGSSVTVRSGNGVVSSSSTGTGGSGVTRGSSASAEANARAGRNNDCAVTTDTHTGEPMPDRQDRKMEK
jgi:hypothetical protein